MYPSRANGRIQSPKSSLSKYSYSNKQVILFNIIFTVQGNSPVIIECEFCHHGCKQSDYKIHRVFFLTIFE
jgi:hypothetical protein